MVIEHGTVQSDLPGGGHTPGAKAISKVVAYNNWGGERYRRFIENIGSTVFGRRDEFVLNIIFTGTPARSASQPVFARLLARLARPLASAQMQVLPE